MDSPKDNQVPTKVAGWVLRLVARLRQLPLGAARAAALHSWARARSSRLEALRAWRLPLAWPPRVPERVRVMSKLPSQEPATAARVISAGFVVREQAPRDRPGRVSHPRSPAPLLLTVARPPTGDPIVPGSTSALQPFRPASISFAPSWREARPMFRAARPSVEDTGGLGRWPSRRAVWAALAVTAPIRTGESAQSTRGPLPGSTVSAHAPSSTGKQATGPTASSNRPPSGRISRSHVDDVRRPSRGVDLFSRLAIPDRLVRHGFEWLTTASRGVRLHTGEVAHRIARQHDADAVAWGEHVFVRDGRFDPASPEGLALLSHELVHVVQHRHAMGVSANADRLGLDRREREALAVERTVLALMRPQQGRTPAGSMSAAMRLASPPAAAVAAPLAAAPTAYRAGEERAVEPPAAQGPASDPAELAKEVYRLFERRLRVDRERAGIGRA